MKGILFAVLMAVSMSAYSFSKGDVQLILTIVSERQSSLTMGAFSTMSACAKAGDIWIESHATTYKPHLRDAFYVCAKTD